MRIEGISWSGRHTGVSNEAERATLAAQNLQSEHDHRIL